MPKLRTRWLVKRSTDNRGKRRLSWQPPGLGGCKKEKGCGPREKSVLQARGELGEMAGVTKKGPRVGGLGRAGATGTGETKSVRGTPCPSFKGSNDFRPREDELVRGEGICSSNSRAGGCNRGKEICLGRFQGWAGAMGQREHCPCRRRSRVTGPLQYPSASGQAPKATHFSPALGL